MQIHALPDPVRNSRARIGAIAHVRRVAAWASYLGRHCGLSTESMDVLRKAVLQHHGTGLAWSRRSMQRLLSDLRPAAVELPQRNALISSSDVAWEDLFGELRGSRKAMQAVSTMRRIAAIAHAFDEILESLPYRDCSEIDYMEELSCLFPESESTSILAHIPGSTPLQKPSIEELCGRLPISQSSANGLWRLAVDEDPHLATLEKLTSGDAVLAGLLVQAANVAEYPLRSPISTVNKAILHIGIPKARKILVAALLRPVFGVGGLQKALWNHSLEAVHAGETVCDLSDKAPREELFIASLMHDIGRVALLASGDERGSLYAAMMAEVDEITAIEQFVFGRDHGFVGAAILERWGFAERISRAVRHHHQPEESQDPLVKALYLMEFIADRNEDLPSRWRLETSARTLGVPMGELFQAGAQPITSWSVLRYAA